MAEVPRRESDVLALANAMVDGYTAYPAEFPHADVATLTTVREEYNSGRLTQICVVAAAKLATDEKAERSEPRLGLRSQLRVSV